MSVTVNGEEVSWNAVVANARMILSRDEHNRKAGYGVYRTSPDTAALAMAVVLMSEELEALRAELAGLRK